jgi:hypothetical protein
MLLELPRHHDHGESPTGRLACTRSHGPPPRLVVQQVSQGASHALGRVRIDEHAGLAGLDQPVEVLVVGRHDWYAVSQRLSDHVDGLFDGRALAV